MSESNISVILTLYKRPENLKIQLEAIKNQSLKPCEILLYQDGTGDTIKIPDEIKNEFNLIEISPENKGVWERFRFAMNNAKSEYVCIFDDDTIPGKDWLKNCYSNMINQEGVYGTIGILCEKPENYPKSDFIRLGWATEIKNRKEVDFVGHSWFLKREWISCMFTDTEKYQVYKNAGEDMCLSTTLRNRYGIKTFVPPHPSTKHELWGSLPEYAVLLGNNKVAISHENNNKDVRQGFISELIKDDYTFLANTDALYVENIVKRYKRARLLSKYIPNKKFRHFIRSKLNEILLD